ncbi:hypothetical protein GGR56DRAFT_673278 [Xylariaceae sp. FL0804]|nr:hypothetical protein GGR56DRAFT_673278 [Xylariaceae sp. FL0804]
MSSDDVTMSGDDTPMSGTEVPSLCVTFKRIGVLKCGAFSNDVEAFKEHLSHHPRYFPITEKGWPEGMIDIAFHGSAKVCVNAGNTVISCRDVQRFLGRTMALQLEGSKCPDKVRPSQGSVGVEPDEHGAWTSSVLLQVMPHYGTVTEPHRGRDVEQEAEEEDEEDEEEDEEDEEEDEEDEEDE